jgi:hypothetical protein
MTLYISIKTPSQELSNSAVNDAITFFAAHAAVAKRQGRLPGGPSLDITFLFSGKNEQPDFSGMRMGGYNQDSQTLFFESAVPEHISHSEQAPRYVSLVLQDAIENASEFFKENNIDFNGDQWLRAIKPLIDAHISPQTSH